MEWLQVLVLILSNLGIVVPLFLWNRSESNADRREAAQDRREANALIQAIQLEIKDFHGRLCAIEERYRGLK